MRTIFLMRHCHTVPGHPMDSARDLTSKGVKQAEDMAEWLRNENGRVDHIISSPFTRALHTAKIMADALGAIVADSRMLEPDGKPEEMWQEIERLAQQSREVLVVGHDPSINTFLMWLLGCDAGVPEVRFEHGAIANIDVKNKPATLKWLVDPKLVINEEQKELEEAALSLAEAIAIPGEEATVKIRPVSDLENGGALWEIQPVLR